MSKDMERKIILIMVLYLVFLGLSGCANTTKANTKSTEQANISVYNGTISKMLGCIFAPSECEKFKNTYIYFKKKEIFYKNFLTIVVLFC